VIARWFAPLVRLAGGEPARVLGLARGLHREARGQLRLAYERSGRSGFGPDAGRWIALAVLVAVSLGLAVLVVALRERAWLAASLLVFAQGAAVFMTAARDAVPLILGQDDHPVVGWWPVSERELLLARAGLLLLAVLETAAASVAVPLGAYLVAVRPPVVAGLGALVGLLLHGLVLAAVLTIAIQGLARLLGRLRARRLVEVIGTLLFVVGLNLVVRSLGERAAGIGLVGGWPLAALPPAWFGAWGALPQAGWPGLAAASLGLATAGGRPGAGGRARGARERGDRERAERRRRGGRDWTGPLDWWLAPWLRGRDGRALRLLVRAHLREDWRFTGALLFLPTLLLVYAVLVGGRFLASDPRPDLLVGRLSVWMALLGLSLGSAFTCTAEPAAAWLGASGVGEARRLLSLQRRLARVLLPAPLLLAVGVALLASGRTAPGALPLLLGLPWLVFELMLALVQLVTPAAPFSRAWRRDGGRTNRAFFWLVMLVWPLAMVWNALVIERLPHGALLTLGLVGLLLVAVRLLLGWRLGRSGLPGLAPRRA